MGKDLPLGIQLLEKSAAQGNTEAQHSLAVIYEKQAGREKCINAFL